ncbi:Uncharacterized protein L484_016362 [Morus notabilis]|uniref:DNA/RNA-binding protein Alba-like domain-containing protein n=1 Tax=Morus notabilis TaxID=981085 RepID=W9QNX0_9ROSA|nr:uncharacterized protein At2g34160 [Morus notabilis]EXB29872.1 Uncharacterized protein L484_016362 [Morus notabilis]
MEVVNNVVVPEGSEAKEVLSNTELDCGGSNGGDTKTGCDASSDQELSSKGKIRIQVSKTKKPLFFYINLAKKYMKQYYDVELTALGMAIPTVVMISESLKRNGLAIQKNISTSTVAKSKDEKKGRMIVKAQIEILLGQADKLEESSAVAATSN